MLKSNKHIVLQSIYVNSMILPPKSTESISDFKARVIEGREYRRFISDIN